MSCRLAVAVLLGFAALALSLGWVARDFEINASAQTLLTEGNAKYIQARQTAEQFSPQEFLLLAYVPKNTPVFSEQSFAQLQQLSRQISEIERVESVRSVLNVPLLVLAADELGSDFRPADWTYSALGDVPMDVMRRVFAQHPIYQDVLVSADLSATALQILFRANPELERLNRELTNLQARRQAANGKLPPGEQQRLRDIQAQIEPLDAALRQQRSEEIQQLRVLMREYSADAELYLGGGTAIGEALIAIVRSDLRVFGLAITIMIAVVLMVLFRGVRWVVLPLLCCAGAAAITVGLFTLLGFKATVISSNFIAIQLILTLAIVVHLITEYRQAAACDQAASQQALLRHTLRQKFAPCLYAGLTTSIGFASLLLADIQPVIDFGWMMVVATAISLLTALVLFPSVLSLLTPSRSSALINAPGLEALGRACASQGHWFIAAGILGLIVAGLGLARLSVENSFIEYFDKDTRVYQELVFIDQKFGGSTPLDIVYQLPADQADDDLLVSASTVQTLQEVDARVNAHASVGKVLSIVDFTEVAQKINNDKPLSEYELTALYWLVDAELRDELLGSFYDAQTRELRLSLRIQDSTPNLNRAELIDALHADMAAAGLAEQDYRFTGLFVLYQDLLQRLFRSQLLTLLAVYAALSVAFLLIFGSLRVACIALVPNLITTVGVLGLMGWLGIPLDFMTMTIAAIAVGIAVDDTIHYLHRYLAELKQRPAAQAAIEAHRSVGSALLSSTLIIALGFGLLMFSDFVPSVMFGLLTALAVSLALLTDLTVLPALLIRLVKK